MGVISTRNGCDLHFHIRIIYQNVHCPRETFASTLKSSIRRGPTVASPVKSFLRELENIQQYAILERMPGNRLSRS